MLYNLFLCQNRRLLQFQFTGLVNTLIKEVFTGLLLVNCFVLFLKGRLLRDGAFIRLRGVSLFANIVEKEEHANARETRLARGFATREGEDGKAAHFCARSRVLLLARLPLSAKINCSQSRAFTVALKWERFISYTELHFSGANKK